MLVTQKDDRSCKTLFRNVIKPRRTDNERIDTKTKYTGVTWGDYHNGIPYDEAMDQVKNWLNNNIVVGHNIRSNERALCFHLGNVAHRVIELNDLLIYLYGTY